MADPKQPGEWSRNQGIERSDAWSAGGGVGARRDRVRNGPCGRSGYARISLRWSAKKQGQTHELDSGEKPAERARTIRKRTNQP